MVLNFLPLHIRYGLSFASDWLHLRAGAHFDEETILNPINRFKMETDSQRRVREIYPEIFHYTGKYNPSPQLGIGVATIPKLLRCPIRYTPNMYPIALPLIKPEDNPLDFKISQLEDQMQWLYRELDTFIDAGYSKYQIGFPDLQGPLNIAMRVIGDNRMLGLIAHPRKASVVDHILEQTSDAYIGVTQAIRKATGRPKKYSFRVAGCTYYYLSPSQWKRFCLPIIHKIATLGSLSLHHCGEANSEKIRIYSKYPWRSVEFGFGSDLKLARQLMHYPKGIPIPFSCRISPYRMLNQSAEQIREDISWILQNAKGGPVSISCVGVPLNTPEENIWTFYRTIEAYNHRTYRSKFFPGKKNH